MQAGKVASLLGTTVAELEKVLTHRVVPAKGDVVVAKQNPARATWGRDALAKVRLNNYTVIVYQTK